MTNPEKQDRRETFLRHIARLNRLIERHQAQDQRFFWIRLGILVAGGVLVFLAYLSGEVRWVLAALGAFILAFSTVVFFHRRLDYSHLKTRLSRDYAAVQTARLSLDWSQIPAALVEPPAAGHPFAADLNLVGPRSIHQLVDTAISQGGSRRLQTWLLNRVPDLDQIRSRQAILAEIRPLAGFRSRLALNGALVSSPNGERWEGEKLLDWLEKHAATRSLRPALLLLGGLALANLLFVGLDILAGLPPVWIVSVAAYIAVYYSQYRSLEDVFEDAQHLSNTLDKFRAVFVYLEKYPYPQQSRLSQLCEPFWGLEQRPSRTLRRVTWIASAASLRGNPLVWMALNLILPWDLFFAHRLSQVKQEMRSRLPVWLDVWYELEALNSLANFAYLNPGYMVPEVVPEAAAGDFPVFAARQVGHPLLPADEKVSNDFSIQCLGEVAIITGSNMSGKSTFLRTLGVNLALAYAGSVVDAGFLRVLPFRVFTCINVSDSLNDGISYFYAEVRRLKTLLIELDQENPFPQFFLIDEIFRGTNNRERQIGGRAYVQALVGKHGAGAISTHDLELVKLADELPGVYNYHFREDVSGQRMVFDYLLRPGPSPTTNALKIMQLEGLPVEPV